MKKILLIMFVFLVSHLNVYSQNPSLLLKYNKNGKEKIEVEFDETQLSNGKNKVKDFKGRSINLTKNNQQGETWVGSVDEFENSFVAFTKRKNMWIGTLQYDGVQVTIYQEGGTYVSIVEDIKDVDCAEPLSDKTQNKTESTTSTVLSDPTVLIRQDILIAYTRKVREFYKSKEAVEGALINEVAKANQAYINSGVNILLNIVALVETEYEQTTSLTDDLFNFATDNDGFMDEMGQLRIQYGADLMHIIVPQATSACGVAFYNGAYGITARTCLSGLTFIHEVGHNQGCNHDREAMNNTVSTNYHYGYKLCLNDGTGFRTIMSYQCPSYSVVRINYFSTPLKTYNGYPIGISAEEFPTGSADNARKLNETALSVSNRNTSPVILSPVNAPSNLMATTIGDNYIDLKWDDNSINEEFFMLENSSDGLNWTLVAKLSTNTTTYKVVNLTPLTSYFFRVSGTNQSFTSNFSNVLYVTTIETPSLNFSGSTSTFIISPNPASNFITLDVSSSISNFRNSKQNVTYQIIDSYGLIKISGILTKKVTEINITNLSIGRYTVKLIIGKKSYSHNFTKG
jgi:hypothetical protein